MTNGRQWRLYSRHAHSRATNFYEVDLAEALVASGDTDPNEAFRYWWLFFRAAAFGTVGVPALAGRQEPSKGGTPTCWLDSIAKGSRDYAKQLGERLKRRIFETIFPHLAQGFLEDRKRRLGIKRRPTDEELHDAFEATLPLLYRLLFLLYAESRDLLPIREAPYRAASLTRIKEEIAERAGIAETEVSARLSKAYSATETAFYDRLLRLCTAMDRGDPSLNVPVYNGGLFITPVGVQASACSSSTLNEDSLKPELQPREQRIARFLAEHKVPDRFLASAIDRTRRNILDALGEQGVAVDPDKLTEVNLLKRHVLKRCIYGVDLNPMAVELAKVSLWLDAFTIGAPLSFLDHHLRCGNSLIGATFKDLEAATKGQLFSIDYEPLLRAIRHVIQVNQMADATAAEVKQSVNEYGRAREELSGYQIVLDLLVARHFGFPNAGKLLTHYGKDLDLSSRLAFKTSLNDLGELASVEEIETLARQPDRRFFHWEIEFPEVFFGFVDADGRRIKHKDQIAAGSAGFDAVVGNPPYDVLAEKELGIDLNELLGYFRGESLYASGMGGKLNLYKLFICRNVPLARMGGGVGHIVPMPLLGDEQAVGVRKLLLTETALSFVEAFPQKDDPRNRVFEDAKLSTCVFVTRRSKENSPIRVRVHPGKDILANSPSLSMRRADVKLYDADNQPIVACSQADWDLATKIMGSGRMARLGEFCKAYQGEVNETTDGAKGNLSDSPKDGPQVLRGSNVCLYVLRPPSQGEAIYLRRARYLKDKKPGAKAWHFQYRRVAIQESCPQNNFRRIIAALIPTGEFCNHVINYFPEPESNIPLELLLAILNGKLSDWYFRLGSTNAHVSHYQLYNLPVPRFAADAPSTKRVSRFTGAIADGDTAAAFDAISDLLSEAPFSMTIRDCIVAAVNRMVEIERDRGDIARSERSALAPAAQPLQDLLDRILFRMAGLTDDEAAGLEDRLAKML